MAKTSKKQKLILLEKLEKQNKKFNDKVMESWFWYMFAFKGWRNEVKMVKEKYNAFGMQILNLCEEIEDLFANFIAVEIKKTKNKEYQKYLISLLNADEKTLENWE